MKVPLTRYGLPQVIVVPAIVLAVMIGCLLFGLRFWPIGVVIAIEALLFVVLIWVLFFFRDPPRKVPQDKNVLLAPADGRITDIEIIHEDSFLNAQALRIGIFLSIFDVHINRSPCAARVEKITYKKGRHKNAMNSRSGRVNESNDIAMVRVDQPRDKLLVRQIRGAIARRIVCETNVGAEFACGEEFGMIKFGSRTELYVPVREQTKCVVKVGDKVRAGLTILMRYQ